MKKYLFSFFILCLFTCFEFGFSLEPDLSNLSTFEDVLEALDSRPASYLDLRIAKLNGLLLCSGFLRNHENEFPHLYDYVTGGSYKVISEQGINKIVCEADIRHLHYEIIEPLCINLRDLAKKCIHPLLADENFVVVISITKDECNNGKWMTVREPIVKWEDGQSVYYKKLNNSST